MMRRILKIAGIVALLLVIFSVAYYSITGRPPWAKKILSGLRLSTDMTEVYPYTPANSATLTQRFMMNRRMRYYEYAPAWNPKPPKPPSAGGKNPIKLYPFPIVENFDRNQLFKNRIDINSLPAPKTWERFGIQGAGVVSSLAIDPANAKNLLIGTEGSGLYFSYDFGLKWAELPLPRNDIRKVFIDPSNSLRFVAVTGHYLFPDSPPTVYQSKDGGKTWDFGYPIAQQTAGGAKKTLPPRDIAMVNDLLTLVAVDQNPGAPSSVLIAQKNALLSDNTPFQVVLAQLATDAGKIKIKKSGFGLINLIQSTTIIVGTSKVDILSDSLYLTADSGKTWKLVYQPEKSLDSWHDITAYDISGNGKRIVLYLKPHVPYKNDYLIAVSGDGGANWETTTITGMGEDIYDGFYNLTTDPWYTKGYLAAQDLVIDETDPDHIALFLYMRGLFESFDGGKTFSKLIYSYKDIKYLKNADGETQAIEPMDLRYDTLKVFPLPGGFSFFMPTDQGLFLLDGEGTLTNMTKDLFLGDTGMVEVTSCPRVYAGLWHVGSYWVNADNTIEGFNGGENWGYGAGGDDECETPVFSPVHGYLYDGKNLNEGKTTWFGDNLDYGWPIEETFKYYEEWWTSHRWWGGLYYLVRVNDAFNTTETIYPNDDKNKRTQAYGVDRLAQGAPYWILDRDMVLWNWENDKWTVAKNFSAGLDKEKEVVKNVSGIEIAGARIVLYGMKGLIISTDNGGTWTVRLYGKKVRALAGDNCGTIYLAIEPDPNFNVGGVYSSENDGANFYKLGSGDGRSFISSLAIDPVDDILYAGTAGESLLRFALDVCNE
ncbi:MAG: hypothetical protein HYU99_01565 [Deltaproteobacteria bacterium]|nr:hypothetical protein [Deltaproteobacteria bacterium]